MKSASTASKVIAEGIDAVLALTELPAFLAAPKGAPVYYGFPVLEGSERDGFLFGVIADAAAGWPELWGDAYVIAPDGSRAGILWQAEGELEPVLCPPNKGRWGVYGFRFPRPVRSEQDLIRSLHDVLPQLKAYYQQALISCPESTNTASSRRR